MNNLQMAFLQKNASIIDQIGTLTKKLEKQVSKEVMDQLVHCTESVINDAFANHEHTMAFLTKKIRDLAQNGDYYLAARFAEGLIEKTKDMQAGKPDTGVKPPKPADEADRLAAVKELNLLDTEPESRFDSITKIATELFKVPISTITLVAEEREWHKSVCGINSKEGSRDTSFCGHAILEEDMLIIPDATKDPRFANNEKVTGSQHIRFYAGMPLLSIDGHKVGTFCLKGTEPKILTPDELEKFRALALWAELEVNATDIGKALTQLRDSIKKKIGVA